ncbi:uncharacterized protein si:ch211-202f5.3 [Polyodon spathula]|uniref:uncharacterized protein si:ch211-202f5.3 n=1 Tax=Polyodon spathula TaxID=7913 RepID=UPI001B7E259B|nr:uncharacterized protein si:ch211-202f5.3 [Polyodon spathula]
MVSLDNPYADVAIPRARLSNVFTREGDGSTVIANPLAETDRLRKYSNSGANGHSKTYSYNPYASFKPAGEGGQPPAMPIYSLEMNADRLKDPKAPYSSPALDPQITAYSNRKEQDEESCCHACWCCCCQRKKSCCVIS